MIIFIILALFLITPATQPAVYAMGRSNQAELVCALATIPLSIAAKGYDAKDQKGKAAVMRIIANGLSVANKALFFYNNKKVLRTIAPERDTLVNGALALRDLSKLLQDVLPYLKAKSDVLEDENHFLDFQHHSTNDVAIDDDGFFASASGGMPSSNAATLTLNDSFFNTGDENENFAADADIFSSDVDDETPTYQKPVHSSAAQAYGVSSNHDPFAFFDEEVNPVSEEKRQAFDPVVWLKAHMPFILKSSSLPILKGLSAAAMAVLSSQDLKHHIYYKQRSITCAALQLLVQLVEEYQDAAPQSYAQKAIAAAIVATFGWLMRELYVLKFGQNPECSVCDNEIEFNDFCVLECGHHNRCKECRRDNVKGCLDSASNNFDQCGECNRPMSHKDFEQIYEGADGEENLTDRCYKERARKTLPKGYVMCPTKGCLGNYQTTQDQHAYNCAHCKKEICTACGNEHGINRNCNGDIKHEDPMTVQQMQVALGENHQVVFKACPHCQTMFNKTSGCDRITCGNSRCGGHWCWRCARFFAQTANEVYVHMHGCVG